MDIDQLFKVSRSRLASEHLLTAKQTPKLPAGSLKRKMPDNPTPEMLKRMKVDAPAPPNVSSEKGKARAVTVEDEPEEDAEFAPGGDADYFAEEDEEGRFYGGGLTQEQKQILNIFDSAPGEGHSDEVSVQ
jgi:beta-catenin-like protein 1